MTANEIMQLVESKQIKIYDKNYFESLKTINELDEDITLVPVFKNINKDNIDYLFDKYPMITLKE